MLPIRMKTQPLVSVFTAQFPERQAPGGGWDRGIRRALEGSSSPPEAAQCQLPQQSCPVWEPSWKQTTTSLKGAHTLVRLEKGYGL